MIRQRRDHAGEQQRPDTAYLEFLTNHVILQEWNLTGKREAVVTRDQLGKRSTSGHLAERRGKERTFGRSSFKTNREFQSKALTVHSRSVMVWGCFSALGP